jgi:hypothetical protein
MPVDLQQRFRAGETGVSPYSDRRARDLLLLERCVSKPADRFIGEKPYLTLGWWLQP